MTTTHLVLTAVFAIIVEYIEQKYKLLEKVFDYFFS